MTIFQKIPENIPGFSWIPVYIQGKKRYTNCIYWPILILSGKGFSKAVHPNRDSGFIFGVLPMKRKILCFLAAGSLALCSMAPTAYALTPSLDIISDTYCVMDAASGQVLIEKNKDKVKAPASITKILTVGIALERGGDPNDRFVLDYKTCHSLEPGATHIALTEGEEISFQDALMATMIMSANDAANAVAQYTAGDMDLFVPLMNEKAAELGAVNSHFENPNGLDADGHQTTAYDMCLITRWALGVEGFTDYYGATSYTMAPTNKQSQSRPFNTSTSIMKESSQYYYEGVIGSKTGYTYNARHTLVTTAERDGMTLICTVMDSASSNDKYRDTAKLLDYCFENFGTLSLRAKNIQDFDVPILSNGEQIGMVNIAMDEDINLVVSRGTEVNDLTFSYNIPDHYENGEEIAPVLTILDPNGQQLYQGPMDFTVGQAAGGLQQAIWKGQTLVYPIKETALAVLKWTGILLGIAGAGLLIARFFIQRHYQKLREERRRQLAEERRRRKATLRKAARERKNTPYDNVTYWPGLQEDRRWPPTGSQW